VCFVHAAPGAAVLWGAPVVFPGEHPRTLSEEWRGAAIMREAYAPREGSDVPVPMNPFRQRRSAADYKPGADAHWPAEAAKRDPSGSKAVPVPERAALAAARDVKPEAEATRPRVEVPSPVVAAPDAAQAAPAREARREEERATVVEAATKVLGEPAAAAPAAAAAASQQQSSS
jgi:hypothetical protein